MRRLAHPLRFFQRQRPASSQITPRSSTLSACSRPMTSAAQYTHELGRDPFSYLPLPSSLVATSSKVTLDHFPMVDHTFDFQDALHFADGPEPDQLDSATDEELISALVIPPLLQLNADVGAGTAKSKGKEAVRSDKSVTSGRTRGWVDSLDPGNAFAALRKRPTYLNFLSRLQPHLQTVWAHLRPLNRCSELVADLLLRCPDVRLLHHVLELDAEGDEPILTSDEQVLIFGHIRSLIRANRLLPLTRAAYLRLGRAAAERKNIEAATIAFDALASMFSHSGTAARVDEDVLPLLEMTVQMCESKLDHCALRFFGYLVEQGIVVELESAAGDGAHPLASRLKILIACVRAMFVIEFGPQARNAAGLLLEYLRETRYHQSAGDTLVETCRAALLARQKAKQGQLSSHQYIHKVLSGLQDVPGGPPLPASIFELIFDTIKIRSISPLVQLYHNLPSHLRPTLSGKTIARLSSIHPKPAVLKTLCDDVDSLPKYEFIPYYATFIKALARGGLLDLCEHYFVIAISRLDLDSHIMLSIVRAARKEAVNAGEPDKIRPFATKVIRLFAHARLSTNASVDDKLALALAFATARQMDSSLAILSGMDQDFEPLRAKITQMTLRAPGIMSLLLLRGRQEGLNLPHPRQLVAQSCFDGRYGNLEDFFIPPEDIDEATQLGKETMALSAEIEAIQAALKGDFDLAYKLLGTSKNMGVYPAQDSVRIILNEAIGAKDWKAALYAVLVMSRMPGADETTLKESSRLLARTFHRHRAQARLTLSEWDEYRQDRRRNTLLVVKSGCSAEEEQDRRDEFTILLRQITDPSTSRRIARRIYPSGHALRGRRAPLFQRSEGVRHTHMREMVLRWKDARRKALLQQSNDSTDETLSSEDRE